MALHSFCGILTLQVGVAIIAVVFWMIATLTFVVNFFEFFNSDAFPVYALTISTFVILLMLAGLIAFFSAYNESNSLCMTGVALTCLITVVWVIISSLSFYNDHSILKFVCIQNRCPETFWLAPLKYRLSHKQEEHIDEEQDDSFTDPSEDSKQLKRKRSVDSHMIVQLSLEYDDWLRKRRDTNNNAIVGDNNDPGDTNDTEVYKSRYIFGMPLIGAVVLFICNFFLFLFSILVLWSYGQELAWTNSYLRDIPDYTTT
ncbi:uncharacterized protein LOC128987599 [Macrosteles quadrilineatus]|uniref:uncharacterized protein LOC128987599 n=1 Tax=Macrosteles quadrilineatus TaxID=74068 RepID=UPI0023E1ECE0|nr:uncharacterized protein LOC128987599 [Macrosteles quadrilineatus]